MCYKFTEQQRAEHILERAQWHTPSAARTSARGTPSRLLLLDTSTGLLVTITPWPFNIQSGVRFRSIEAWSKAYYWTGETLSQLSLVLTSWAAAEALRGWSLSPLSPYLSLSNQGIVLLPFLSLPFSTCPTCSTSLTCSLGLIRNSYSLPGNVVY